MKAAIVLVFLVTFTGMSSQVRIPGYIESRLDMQTESFKAFTDHAHMILNTANGDFFMDFDVSALKTGDARLDSTLMAIGQQLVVYKANISESIFLFNQQIDDEKQHKMQGLIAVNGVEYPAIAYFQPKSLADKNDVKSYRMDFKLELAAGSITIKGLESKLLKAIVFRVQGGKLNVLP